jgi:deazaflavin-dependent oxidoreductase (nitroreductase family)
MGDRITGDRAIGEDLARLGRVLLLETRGRVTGRPVRTAVGFVEAGDGSLLVAAGDPDADWARNLEADPRCRVTIEERTQGRLAVPLEGTDRNDAIVALILRYGTPAERLGVGPAFRLIPAEGLADPGRRPDGGTSRTGEG